MSFIECPNLPTSRVEAVLISSSASRQVIQNLERWGVEALIVPPCADIAPQVASHPDMMFHHLGERRLIYYRGADSKVCRRLEELGFELTQCDITLEPQYPRDIALNAARVGNYIFCSARSTDKTILDYCAQNRIHIIPVKQGYAKCSVCIVDKDSIITADKGIALAAKKSGINVLLIRAGFIDLPGYGAGFIGGCCGKLGSDKMFFYGDIRTHPDYNAIKDFIGPSVSIETLGEFALCDIGSIIPLTQSN